MGPVIFHACVSCLCESTTCQMFVLQMQRVCEQCWLQHVVTSQANAAGYLWASEVPNPQGIWATGPPAQRPHLLQPARHPRVRQQRAAEQQAHGSDT